MHTQCIMEAHLWLLGPGNLYYNTGHGGRGVGDPSDEYGTLQEDAAGAENTQRNEKTTEVGEMAGQGFFLEITVKLVHKDP